MSWTWLQPPTPVLDPPLHEEVVRHQPEPGGELHAVLAGVRLPDQLVQLLAAHVPDAGDLVGVRPQLHVPDEEQNVGN